VPCLSGRFDPTIGVLINLGIHPVQTDPQASQPPPRVTLFPALVDTGANATGISPFVMQTLGFQPIGMREIASATQSISVPVYLVDLLIPFGPLEYTMRGKQVFENLPRAVEDPSKYCWERIFLDLVF
jgi:hypothetical protein